MGDDHPTMLQVLSNLGLALTALGELHEDERLGDQSVAAARRVLGPDLIRLGHCLDAHAATLIAMKRFQEAEPRALEAHSIYSAIEKEHRYTIWSAQRLADLYASWHAAEPGKGYDVKAAKWRAKLESLEASTRPATPPVGAP